MINITFPDKSVRKYESSINWTDLAKSISNSLPKVLYALKSTEN